LAININSVTNPTAISAVFALRTKPLQAAFKSRFHRGTLCVVLIPLRLPLTADRGAQAPLTAFFMVSFLSSTCI
jgi:hypothetical protein